MRCKKVQKKLAAYIKKTLKEKLQIEIREHLLVCDHCKAIEHDIRNVNAFRKSAYIPDEIN